MDKNLKNLADRYGTDKLDHGYIDYYEKHLPDSPKKLLEIGCLKGASVRMWKEAFPDTEIHSLDLFEEFPIPEIEGVTFWKGSQVDSSILEQLRAERFDVIIDDGSHNSRDQLISFYALFQPPCLYIIEDLHCCNEEFYRQGLPFDRTMLSQIKRNMWRSFLYDDKIGFIYAD